VQFSIDRKALSFYNAKLDYVAEPGEFQVQIGLDSEGCEDGFVQSAISRAGKKKWYSTVRPFLNRHQ
jgi:hypothetical protein